MHVPTLNSVVNDVSPAIAIDNAWKRQLRSSGTVAGNHVKHPPKNVHFEFILIKHIRNMNLKIYSCNLHKTLLHILCISL